MNNYIVLLLTANICVGIMINILVLLYHASIEEYRERNKVERINKGSKRLIGMFKGIIASFIPVINILHCISLIVALYVKLRYPLEAEERTNEIYDRHKGEI